MLIAARWTAQEHSTLVLLLDYRTSRKDGKLYSGVVRRTQQKQNTITSEKRATSNSSTLKTSECIQNTSDEIIADNAHNGNRGRLNTVLTLTKELA